MALVGPNGAGKSTLLALLAGALPPSAGQVRSPPGTRVGWAPQRPGHYGRLTARENLELFAQLGGGRDPAGEADAMLQTFRLPGDRLAGELSVGIRQRLNLAVALLGAKDVLLLDEPTASLDGASSERLWGLLDARRDEVAVVVATQSAQDTSRAERILALDAGRLVFAGPHAEYDRSTAAAAPM